MTTQPLNIKVTFPKRANGALAERSVGKLVIENITRGEMACLVNALASRAASESSIARDLFMMIRDQAIDNGKWPEVAELCHTEDEIDEARRGPDKTEEQVGKPRLAPGKYEFPNRSGDFSGIHDAEKFLTEHGYSYGSMQRDEPIGVKYGAYQIEKWRNLRDSDRKVLDGTITPFVAGWRDLTPPQASADGGAEPVFGGAVVTITK